MPLIWPSFDIRKFRPPRLITEIPSIQSWISPATKNVNFRRKCARRDEATIVWPRVIQFNPECNSHPFNNCSAERKGTPSHRETIVRMFDWLRWDKWQLPWIFSRKRQISVQFANALRSLEILVEPFTLQAKSRAYLHMALRSKHLSRCSWRPPEQPYDRSLMPPTTRIIRRLKQ